MNTLKPNYLSYLSVGLQASRGPVNVCWSHMPRLGPSGIQQQVHVGRGEPPGGHLLNFHHGTPPLQHDGHHPSTGKPQHFCKVNIQLDASLNFWPTGIN